MTDAFTPDAATRAQIDAANPEGSVWLAANAGSGKTRVLTDRVAWLLLDGAAPERILCLTYTKAAAGEMQNRLFKRLGQWAMLSDDDLRREITRLGAARGTIPPEQLRRARTLFARAIETPGGLKIQTIHAFCASLLRRFPLEAGVTPTFSEMDDTAKARLHAEVLDDMAADPERQALVDGIASRLTDSEPSKFLEAVARLRGAIPALSDAELRDRLGIIHDSPEAALADLVGEQTLHLLTEFMELAKSAPGKSVENVARQFELICKADATERLDLLTAACLNSDGSPRKTGRWPKAVQAGEFGPLVERFNSLVQRVLKGRMHIGAFETLAQTKALHAFAPAFVAEVEARKTARGWLDFDDQIAGAQRLLSTSDMAQWVLFKLDGGIDHILVDEAQDTSPGQWEVITRLAAEFAAGLGAREDVRRTLFVVGDRKQSIYGFQGADLKAFEAIRLAFGAMLPKNGPQLRDHALLYSFRSSPIILKLVDAVFAEDSGLGPAPEHIAFFQDRPGRVDLWPAIPKEKDDKEDREWFEPMDRPASNDADVVLADHVANAIDDMIRSGTAIGTGDARRPIVAGDILILLQRRNKLFYHIIRACKARGLNLAGADRLKLSSDLAVKDLIAALTWTATPDDDLSLATVLRSPLCNTTEEGLFALAHGRKGRLWDALRHGESDPQAIEMLADLLRVSDVLRPHEMLQRILIRHDGRRRLLARLGAESAEAIDALLGQALAYEQLETPSLFGFLGWLASADVDVKRQGASGSIRVMTVHGAKGLEAPVVILPETMSRKIEGAKGVRRLEDDTPVWLPTKAGWSPAVHAMNEASETAERAERHRLLYVALTRAESWLIVGAAGDLGKEPGDSWYGMINEGMKNVGAEPHDFPTGTGLRIESGDWSAMPRDTETDFPVPDRPEWLETPVPAPDKVAARIAPSALPGPKALPGDMGDDTEAALRRGTALHALLEHLPNHAPDHWDRMARAILRSTDDAAALLAEARAVLEASELAHIFAPGTLAEVPFALPATADRPAIFGTMDRVIVGDDRVLIVDFKSNRVLPDTAQALPGGLRNQMGAYVAAARAIWPDHRIDAAILWTAGPRLMPLPHELVTGFDAAIDPVRPPA
ncbi:double-strand break repair helicase AddA [Jannaschia pohangensis]|uniref:DNA 3'-5' helicase n=1 Tax=Jannaschia pohangensis TaxID=390807 RepID=A0A1I3TYZ2_9RHOB|nr:double-strand break repair helicase AddA [Jannaschia pohangensis]SFJ75519.1 DNA helicase/exodeoxyribonuclease V, subunit A [Jannaschia pohangensis]